MNSRMLTVAVIACLTFLSGCKAIGLDGIFGGGAALAQAPAAQAAIAECVADDPVAQLALKGPNDFFQTGYDAVTRQGADIPVLDLVNASPEYFEQIPDQWDAIWDVLDGRDCGPVVAQFRGNSEAAWSSIKKAIEASDRIKTACSYWGAIAPVATMFSGVPLPSKVPGC